MLSAALVALSLASPVAAPAAPQAQGATCPAAAGVQLTSGGPAKFSRLDELPTAHLQLAVMRTIHGCEVATIREQGVTYYVPTPSVNRTVHTANVQLRP